MLKELNELKKPKESANEIHRRRTGFETFAKLAAVQALFDERVYPDV